MTAGSTLQIIPLSRRQDRGRPYEVALTPEDTGLPEPGVALVQQLRVIDKKYIVGRLPNRMSESAMERIEVAMHVVFDLSK